MEIKTKLCTIGEPNINGLIYSKEMVESILKTDPKKLIGTIGSMNDTQPIEMEEVSHKVNNIYKEGNDVYAELEVIDTNYGDILKQLIEKNCI